MATPSTSPQGDLLTLARLALVGRPQDVQALLHKLARRYQKTDPDTAQGLLDLLRQAPSRMSPIRRSAEIPLPIDGDSRLQLLRVEQPGSAPDAPILAEDRIAVLHQIIAEHAAADRLHAAGLEPSRSVLFVGPPGVGKTLSARWLAATIGKPLLILDLSAVMSSLLGKTGNNLRAIFDYAKSVDGILFLDELDAVAKRRDDSGEIGELKRLVTVLLQEIDDWPADRLLIAATNHPTLLDPAIWRRFELILEFDKPDAQLLAMAITRFLGNDVLPDGWLPILTTVYRDFNFSDAERALKAARRRAVIDGTSTSDALETSVLALMGSLERDQRLAVAQALSATTGVSQRRVSEITGISRDTLRKHTASAPKKRKLRTEIANGRQ